MKMKENRGDFSDVSAKTATLLIHAVQIRFRKEQEFLASERLREKELRKQAYRREQERIAKAENARKETESILERQIKDVEARKLEMQRRDEERRQAQIIKSALLVRFPPETMHRLP